MTERDEHAGPVPDVWEADKRARAEKGRVVIFNATRPGGLDGWTMDQNQYQAVRDLILEMIDGFADDDGTIRLQAVVVAAQDRYSQMGASPTTPGSRRQTWRLAARSNASRAAAPNESPAGATNNAHRAPSQLPPRSMASLFGVAVGFGT